MVAVSYFYLLKYVFTLILIIRGRMICGSDRILFCAIIELAGIFFLTEAIRNAVVRNVINDILLLLLNAQMLVLLFGGDYISLVMLTNVDNLSDLSGKFLVYAFGVAAVLFFSFFPAGRLEFMKPVSVELLAAGLFGELAFTLVCGNMYSPFFAYVRLIDEAQEAGKVRKELSEIENCTSYFYRKGVSCVSVDRPEALKENPNIVLILTEGLSENIIKDDRSITPNLQEYEKRSVSFENYYNHTFATYRGISGQLYSGYQLDNYDSNSLIGIHDILSDHGYNTSFINTEPNLVAFSRYLEDMGFDELISVPGSDYQGQNGSLSDKEAYEKLFSVMEEKSASGQPYFSVIYTFGTHASFDSPDEKYGDGSVAELNKFYNMDYQFGSFMKRFDESPVSDNTIIVFTADHATYADLYYNDAFPDYVRENPQLDQIPLFIYHKGVQPQVLDANGRNSLDLTSTILDYIDINAPNYFLGASLFHDADNYNNMDRIFTSSTKCFSSENAVIRELNDSEEETAIVAELLKNYFAAKMQYPEVPD